MFRILVFFDGRQLDRQFLLGDGREHTLGREADNSLGTEWDERISRHHAVLTADAVGIHLRRLDSAANPVFVDGEQVDEVTLSSGQSFVIGASRFELQQVTQSDSPRNNAVQQLPIDRKQLQQLRYEDADKRIEVLASLPAVIRESGIERDLHIRLANLLLAGIQHADGVAMVRVDQETERVSILHQERRYQTDGSLLPSTRLVQSAAREGRTILHLWDESTETDTAYTQDAGFNWAFCSPFSGPRSDESSVNAFYVAGRSPAEGAKANQKRIHADVKFTEFIGEIVSSLQRQRDLEQQQTGLRQFFSPPVLEALGQDLDTSLLEPRECEVTVLFCDLRGFSQQAEEQADNLTGLLERVSLALEVMTSQILRFGGVTGDFQGDAALGFWGWPIDSDEAALNACRAALAIREQFAKAQVDPDSPLANFET
ncbi:MAG TPA: adenylate/guanylate cyclase domain-containing protein, partial [Planctomycetaceae bacterium]|nr:adenylate/guanylate cyclase domain-containing protein [Planctomycetaceae bacterium]